MQQRNFKKAKIPFHGSKASVIESARRDRVSVLERPLKNRRTSTCVLSIGSRNEKQQRKKFKYTSRISRASLHSRPLEIRATKGESVMWEEAKQISASRQ